MCEMQLILDDTGKPGMSEWGCRKDQDKAISGHTEKAEGRKGGKSMTIGHGLAIVKWVFIAVMWAGFLGDNNQMWLLGVVGSVIFGVLFIINHIADR